MSLPEPDRPILNVGPSPLRSAVIALVAALTLAPLLSACGDAGFRPLYGSSQFGGTNVSQKLAQVDVATIPGRVGQAIRNELIFQATGGGVAPDPAYRLEVAIRESTTSMLIRRDGDSQSKTYTIEATFQLIRRADKAVVLTGTSHGQASFERFTSIFANVRAQKDAEDRVAKTIGEELKSRLAAYLSTTA